MSILENLVSGKVSALSNSTKADIIDAQEDILWAIEQVRKDPTLFGNPKTKKVVLTVLQDPQLAEAFWRFVSHDDEKDIYAEFEDIVEAGFKESYILSKFREAAQKIAKIK